MTQIRIAQMVPDTEAEGPGRRFAVWVQGCPIRCPGCCNPEMFKADAGTVWDVAELAAHIVKTPMLEGLTLLGGEPFAQAEACAALARAVRAHDDQLSVMVFSGYTLDDLLLRTAEPGIAALLANTDLLVDGRYEHDQPEPEGGRRWIGSRNQVMHHLSTFYVPEDPRLRAPNTIELRLDAGGLTVNGWPQGSAFLRRDRR
jgi:anaerobic ribonucleoside-triphosphate reductase activating protein